MSRRTPSYFVWLVILLLSFSDFGQAAPSPEVCVAEFQQQPQDQVNALTASQADALLERITRRSGLTSIRPVAIACEVESEAIAWMPAEGSNLRRLNYIVLNPQMMKKVIGESEEKAIFILGHELGHFVNLHHTSRKTYSKLQKETEADHFGGCVAARMRVPWSNVSEVIEQIRFDTEGKYPTVEKSKRAAALGFSDCGGRILNEENPLNEAFEGTIGWAYFGRIADGSWTKKYFQVVDADSDYPQKNDKVVASVDVNLRSEMGRFIVQEGRRLWINGPKSGLIPAGQESRVLEIREADPGFVWMRLGN